MTQYPEQLLVSGHCSRLRYDTQRRNISTTAYVMTNSAEILAYGDAVTLE